MAGIIIYWLCNGIFVITCISIGVIALRRKKPMWFYAGTEEVEQEKYADIESFNQKNAFMWFSYATVILLVSIIGIFISKVIFLLLYLGTIIGGFIAMILYYSHIHDQHTK